MNFFEKYGYEILVTVAVIVVLICFVVPFVVGVGKSMWQWALS